MDITCLFIIYLLSTFLLDVMLFTSYCIGGGGGGGGGSTVTFERKHRHRHTFELTNTLTCHTSITD